LAYPEFFLIEYCEVAVYCTGTH